jgi:hypothetical protein
VVLTKGGAGRWTAGGELTIVGNIWVMTELDGREIWAWVERADARNGKMVWRQCSRVPFIGQGWQEVSGRGRSPVGVEWSPLMVTVLRSLRGNDIGEGKTEKQRLGFVFPWCVSD